MSTPASKKEPIISREQMRQMADRIAMAHGDTSDVDDIYDPVIKAIVEVCDIYEAHLDKSERTRNGFEMMLQLCVNWIIQAGHSYSCDQAVPHMDGGIAYHDETKPCTCDHDEVLSMAHELLTNTGNASAIAKPDQRANDLECMLRKIRGAIHVEPRVNARSKHGHVESIAIFSMVDEIDAIINRP